MAVNLTTDIKPISYIKTNAAGMMKYVTDRRNPIVITQNSKICIQKQPNECNKHNS